MSSYLYNLYDNTRRALTPVLLQSAFLEKGVLTPEEFVKAGDSLVHNCPSWQWAAGDPSKSQSILPKDKQYLITKGVACYNRVSTMQAMHSVDEMTGEHEGWCAPSVRKPDSGDEDDDDAVLISSDDLGDGVGGDGKESTATAAAGGGGSSGGGASSTSTSNKSSNNSKNAVSKPTADDDDDGLGGMEDASLALEDDTAAGTSSSSSASASSSSTSAGNGETQSSSIIKSRRYDISITYDLYYYVPRIWLFGYNERGSTLSIEQIYQDVMQDYARKTVDSSPHPHTGKEHASIHPCQHATAMLSFIDALKESGKTPIVENYMFVFLKFIQSVVPTIEYDFTMDVEIHSNSSSSSSSSSSSGSGGGK